MSPRVDPATTLPVPRRRSQNPLFRMIAEALDHVLLCHARSGTRFSISDVRDELLALPELADVNPTLLRYRVRDRVKVLKQHGLLNVVGVRGRNRPLYLMSRDILTEEQNSVATPPAAGASPADTTPSSAPLISHLEQERSRLQTAMQVAISEAEHYQSLIQAFPDVRQQISPLLEAAIERGGRLQGQWDANLRVRQALAETSDRVTTEAHRQGESA